ncbi:MAG: CoA-binding protein [Pseudomonadota bacterium]
MIPSDEHLLQVLIETRTIALVGASLRSERASNRIGRFLVGAGYRVIPVNPVYAAEPLFDTTVRASLADVDEPVDMLNLFRRSEHIPGEVQAALTHLKGLKSVWMQLGIANADARRTAIAAGLRVVEDRCIMVEHQRLMKNASGAVRP